MRFVEETAGGEAGIEARVDAPFSVDYVHRVRVTRGALEVGNPALLEVLEPSVGGKARVLAFVDDGVAAAWPGIETAIEAYAGAHRGIELAGPVTVVPGGERAKNDAGVVERILGAIERARICRRSYVMAVGGGAVLDAVGYSAAIAHRGVRLVRLPTTTLSQDDSGVGVKNGVNAFGKKNFLGVFAPAWAVINDEAFLETLSDRDWRCGFSEAVKVALIKDESLFERIERDAGLVAARDMSAAGPILRRCAELHIRHITAGGDAFETTKARPLDFGHWAAHKLEQMSGFELRHGEAVAIGLAIDCVYSSIAGLCARDDAARAVACLEGLGFGLHDEAMLRDELMQGMEEFREHLGGELTITMLGGIGRGIDVHEIDGGMMREAVAVVSQRS